MVGANPHSTSVASGRLQVHSKVVLPLTLPLTIDGIQQGIGPGLSDWPSPRCWAAQAGSGF